MTQPKSILEQIHALEQRVAALEAQLAEKTAVLQELSQETTSTQSQPSSSAKQNPSTRAEKRSQAEAATSAKDEQPQKKETLFPKIGAIVEQSADVVVEKEEAAANDDEEYDENDLGETGMRTSALGVTEIQSMCMQCHENGVTKLLMTEIPHFREVILMSFMCPHCGFKDVQIKPGTACQEKGQKFIFNVECLKDMSRQIIKSDSCNLRIEELDFDIPAGRGVITNLEGLLTEACDSLTETQDRRRLVDGPEACELVDKFVTRLRGVLAGEAFPFTAILDDPAGNSYVENPFAPRSDPQLKTIKYIRTREQQEALGLQVDDPAKSYKTGASLGGSKGGGKQSIMDQLQHNFAEQEVLQIPSPCPNCREEGTADTCIVNLPFFKEVIIMAFNCDNCGFKDTEIKGGGAIPAQGRLETLKVLDPAVDLARDVIKSDTAGVTVPELELELTRGSLGGMYTTVEGLMQKMMDNLFENRMGDSQDADTRTRLDKLENDMKACIAGTMPFTLIVQDPLANSFVYSPFDPPSSDPRLTVVSYDRSWEEDEELGLHDMNVDDVGFAPISDSHEADETFQHLQKGQKDTHPSPFAKGMDD